MKKQSHANYSSLNGFSRSDIVCRSYQWIMAVIIIKQYCRIDFYLINRLFANIPVKQPGTNRSYQSGDGISI